MNQDNPAAKGPPTEPLLSVRGLVTQVSDGKRLANACDGVDLELSRGRILGLAGESGSGKSLTALSIMRLLSGPKIVAGKILLEGRDLVPLSEREMRAIRGRRMAMVFQEPAASLDPVFTIGDQLLETLRILRGLTGRAGREAAIGLLESVKIPDAAGRMKDIPGKLSGGMQQRAMMALALAGDPDLLIADEPTTALDVTVQAGVLALIRQIREERGMAVLMITHDFGVIAETCDEVAVLYAGRVVETGDVASIFADPLHPYTRGLLESVRSLESGQSGRTKPKAIPGSVPAIFDLGPGCAFRERCQVAIEICRSIAPEQVSVGLRTVRCHRIES